MLKTKKMVFAGVLLAMGIILPQIFHLSGIPNAGAVFLPMHIPVILSGFILGPVYGAIIGILCPTVSMLLTSMPSFARLPYMICELVAYGAFAGLFFYTLKLRRKSYGTVLSLIIAMILGRLFYGVSLYLTLNLFGVKNGGFEAAITATTVGAPGIVMQLLIIPIIVYAIDKGGYIDEFNR